MSLTSFIVSRNWASSWLRVLLTLLGIALGVAIVVAIYVMDHNTIQSRLLAAQPLRGQVDLEVLPLRPERAVAEVVDELRGHAGVRDVAIWRESRGVLSAGTGGQEVVVFGLGPLPAGAFAHYVVASGRDLVAADADPATTGVLLGAAAAQALGVDVGGEITVAEPPALQRVECKDGVLTPAPVPANATPFVRRCTVVGVIAAERLGKREQGLVVVAPIDVADRLRPLGGSIYHLLRDEGADLDRLRHELRSGFVVQDARSAMIGEGADERAFRNGLKVLGGLALLLGMYVVFQTLSHGLVSRVRQLGLLRCLGAGTGAITRIFLLDALLLGVIGSGLGVLLGMLLARVLQQNRISSLGLGKEWSTFLIPVFPVAWTFTLGVLFTLGGAMFPLVRARQVSALDILRARGLAPGKDDGIDLLRGVHLWMFGLLVLALPFAYLAMTPLAAEEGSEMRMVLLQLAGILGLFGSVLLLAPGLTSLLGRALVLPLRPLLPMSSWLVAKVLGRASGRIAASVCGLSAVLLAVLGLKSITHSLHADVGNFAAAALHERVFVRCQPTTPAAAQALAALPGVAAVEAFEGEERGAGFLLRGVAPAAAAGRDGPLEGDPALVRRYSDERVRTLVVSRRLAKSRQWQAGDLVAMRDKNGVPVSYEVLLVDDRVGFDGDERAFAFASPHWLRQDFCIPATSVAMVTLRLQPGADATAVGDAAKAALPGISGWKDGAAIEAYMRRDVGKDFRLFDLLLFLMLVLAGVGLLNGMTIAMLGRARELGVLRALGITRGALGGSFVLEGAVVAALASILSCGLGAVLATVLVLGMNQVARLDAPVTLPWPWFLLVPVLAFVTALLASVVPAVRALRESPAESVRYE